MGRGRSKIQTAIQRPIAPQAENGYDAQGIMRTVKPDGVYTSFKDKQAVLTFTGANEWTKYEAPRGEVYIMPDGALKTQDTIRKLTDAGVKHTVLYGQRIDVPGTGLFVAPISVKLNNTKTKRVITTNRHGLQNVVLK